MLGNVRPLSVSDWSVSLTDGLLRRSEAQAAGSGVESGGPERSHGSQRGAQFVLVVPKQRRLSRSHC